MRFRVLLNGANVSNIASLENLEISRRAHEAISTARVRFIQRLNAGDKFAARLWEEWDFLEIVEDDTPANLHFRGWVTEIQRQAFDNEKFAVDVSAVDLAVRLDRKVSASVFTSTTDRDIAKGLANEAGVGISLDDANIDFTATLASFDTRDMIIREAFERLCEITGCRWHLDPANALHYYKPGNRFSPFNLSDVPDGVLWMPYQMQSFQREFSTGANRITLLGGIGEAGTEIKVTLDDPPSVTQYGALEAVTIDRQITATAVANLKVQADLAQRSMPRISGRALLRFPPVEFWRLRLGQMIGIKSALYGVDSAFVIHGIREFLDFTTDIAIEIEWGAREADIVSTFRMLMRESPDLPEATIGPGTVIPGENIVGTIGVPGQDVVIAAETVTGTLSGSNVIVAGESIQGTISGDLVAVDAGTLEGVIAGEDIEISAQTITSGVLGGPGSTVEIDATKITVGVIVGAQLTDQILDSLRLVGPGMGVVERIPSTASLPALPNLEYPVGSTVLQSAIYGVSVYGTARYGSTLYEARADNQWYVTSASASLTGILKAADIESITANQITGVIIASQIETIRADQITGLIQGDQIGTINAESITAVNAEVITGELSAETITSLNAGDITMVTRWTETQIQSVSASSITAGTITALVTMTSPDIRITGTGYNLTLNNTVGLEIVATGGSTRKVTVNDAQFKIETGASVNTSLNEQGLIVVCGANVVAGVTATSLAAGANVHHGSHDIQIEAQSGHARISMLGSTTYIDLQGTLTNYIYTAQYRQFVGTSTISLPSTTNRWINAYDISGLLIGKIPVFVGL